LGRCYRRGHVQTAVRLLLKMRPWIYRRAQIENESELRFIAEVDVTIPALFDSDFPVDEKAVQDRMTGDSNNSTLLLCGPTPKQIFCSDRIFVSERDFGAVQD